MLSDEKFKTADQTRERRATTGTFWVERCQFKLEFWLVLVICNPSSSPVAITFRGGHKLGCLEDKGKREKSTAFQQSKDSSKMAGKKWTQGERERERGISRWDLDKGHTCRSRFGYYYFCSLRSSFGCCWCCCRCYCYCCCVYLVGGEGLDSKKETKTAGSRFSCPKVCLVNPWCKFCWSEFRWLPEMEACFLLCLWSRVDYYRTGKGRGNFSSSKRTILTQVMDQSWR